MKANKSSHCLTDSTCRIAKKIYLPQHEEKRNVVIGGGFSGLKLVKGLKNKNIQVVLIDNNNFNQFKPLIYPLDTRFLEPYNNVFPFRKQIQRCKNMGFSLAEIEKVEPLTNTVFTDKGSLIYNYLVLASDTTTNYFDTKTVKKNSKSIKYICDSLNISHTIIQNLKQAAITCDAKEREFLINFVTVSGHADIEIAVLLKGEQSSRSIYKDFCPMALGGSAYWLSSEKNILNPYFGDKMLKCGSVKEVLQ